MRRTHFKPPWRSAYFGSCRSAHEYEEASRDMREYFSLLSPGGIMIGDDYHFSWPGVVRAANEFAAEQALPLMVESPKFIVQKP